MEGKVRLDEFFRDPVLSVACVLLIVVSIGWMVVVRMIARNLRNAADPRHYDPEKDLWIVPPP